MREVDRGHIEKTGLKEIAWFFSLWGLGVATVLALGGVIRLILLQ